jgi:hypothetical protein
MQYSINRYDLDKGFLSTGTLTIIDENHLTQLIYADSQIKLSASELHHPLMALEKLRKILEAEHQSLLACNGCRIDTAYRPSGGYGVEIIELGKPALDCVDMFEPTTEIEKLCTVDEHKAAYEKWWDSVVRK